MVTLPIRQTFLGAKGIDPVTLRPIAPAPRRVVRIKASGEGMVFSEAAAKYINELQRDAGAKVTEQTRGQYQAIYRLFEQFADDPPLTAVEIPRHGVRILRCSRQTASTLGQVTTNQKSDVARITNTTRERRGSNDKPNSQPPCVGAFMRV